MPQSRQVQLKNGTEAFLPVVLVTMDALRQLLEDRPVVFYELFQLCLDPHYEIFSTVVRDQLVSGGWLNDSGVHDSIRHIVLSAVEHRGPDLVLTTPIRETPCTEYP